MYITVWNEYRHEKENPVASELYPGGIHKVLADFLGEDGHDVLTATLDEAEHGLTDDVLNNTDVLLWWGHKAHEEVSDTVVQKVQKRVLEGMGLIVLHSAHLSKVFRQLMGTSCELKWREEGDTERLWVVDPTHPITEGIDECIELEQEEMYGEHFDIPTPDELIFVSWFSGGEVFRSGATFKRGRGKIFYFQPGHETYPSYHHPSIQRVIKNAAKWAKPWDTIVPVRGHTPL